MKIKEGPYGDRWEFELIEHNGMNGMLAFHRFNTQYEGYPNKQYRGGEPTPGVYCGYVEIRPEICDRILYNSLYIKGTLGYFEWKDGVRGGEEVPYTEFPDGTPAKEGMIVIGWDYNHSWNCSLSVHEDMVMRDVKGAIDEILTEGGMTV